VTNRREVGFLLFARNEIQLAQVRLAVLKHTQEYKEQERQRKLLVEAAIKKKKIPHNKSKASK